MQIKRTSWHYRLLQLVDSGLEPSTAFTYFTKLGIVVLLLGVLTFGLIVNPLGILRVAGIIGGFFVIVLLIAAGLKFLQARLGRSGRDKQIEFIE